MKTGAVPGPGRFVVDTMAGATAVADSTALSTAAQTVMFDAADRMGVAASVLAAGILEIVMKDQGLLQAILEEFPKR